MSVLGIHTVQLDSLSDIHSVFHVNLLCLTSINPLFSQIMDDAQPSVIEIDEKNE